MSLSNIFRWLVVASVVFLSQNFLPFTPKIIFLDVGQGDSILILPEPGVQILVDGGPDDVVLEKLGKYMPPWDKKIELLILTHPHMDHIEGLGDVLGVFEIEHAIYNYVCYDLSVYEFLRKMEGNHKDVVELYKYLVSGRDRDWVLKFKYPPRLDYRECYTVENINNGSVVVLFEYKQTSFLLMGDAEKEEEKALLELNLVEDIDVLKAGHHCSKTASSDKFLDVIKPELVICSVGKDNFYGHPHEETLEKFRQRGIKYLLTSEEGDIVINL